MNNKIQKINVIETQDRLMNLEIKVNEIAGMVNEHTDKINEIIRKINLEFAKSQEKGV